MQIQWILASFSLGVALTAQTTRNHDVPLKNWPAPLYWQPSPAETEAARARLDPAIRPPTPEATTPVGSLVFVAITPCRVVDTRTGQGFTGPFGPPSMMPNVSRSFPIQTGGCSIPSTARAYSFNVTVIPNPLGTAVGYLTVWPAGQAQPNAVTVDDYPTGDLRNNAAIVPAGTPNGSVSAITNGAPDLVLDINGYFAPSTGITLAQGTAAAPSLSFAGDAGTGLFSSGAATLNFSTGGTNAMTIQSNGDLDLPGSIRKSGTLFLHNLGTQNLGVGPRALASNTMGTQNTATGFDALASNTTGNSNTANGVDALAFNTGSFNTATGAGALNLNTTGANNTANGDLGLFNNTTGNNNTATGAGALVNNATGSNNIAVGNVAGYNITTTSNNIDIGNTGTGSDSGAIRIGTSGTQTSFFAAGILGVTAPSGMEVFISTGGQLGTVSSSRRYKEDIDDMGDASKGLLRLRPVTFRYQRPYEDGSKPIDYGLIAEEVAEVYPDLVVKGATGRIETVQYHKLVPMLLNELQKDHEAIQSLQAQVSALQKALETLAPVERTR